jgi:hypothetical protein
LGVDISAMGGVSYDQTGAKYPSSWAGRYRYLGRIFITLSNQTSRNKLIVWILGSAEDLKLISIEDILDHFVNGDREGSTKTTDVCSFISFICIFDFRNQHNPHF